MRKQRGQGMTEYIIIVALIACGAIGVYNLYGRTARLQTGAIAASLGGDSLKATDTNKSAHNTAFAAGMEAKSEITLKNFSEPAGVGGKH
jgi:type IV pilus assembly protein PilA